MTFDEQVVVLRAEYAKVDRIDPSDETYPKLCALLDSMDDVKLQQLADAKIKWLSMLSFNRLTRRRMGYASTGPRTTRRLDSGVGNKV